MKPTNLLFIMADEHNPHILGCYGNPVVHTRTIDALAGKGTRFANAYCNAPICVPSRASFATGRYGHQIASWDNAAPYTGHAAPSWGHRLTAQGYSVTTIGKLHYRSMEDPTGFPDQRIPMHVLDGVGDLYGLLRGEMPVPDPSQSSRRHILQAGIGESEYIRYDRAITERSVKWLREEAPLLDRPWTLFVSFTAPHFPLIVPQEYFDRHSRTDLPMPIQHEREQWPQHPAINLHRRLAGLNESFGKETLLTALAAYYGLVSFLDDNVGKILRALSETGLNDRTRIIYTSDHGDMLGEHGLWYKSSMYEGSLSVPLILTGPDVPQGKVISTNASLVDCFPTILDAVGADLNPEDTDLPGESLLKLAQGPDRRRTIFSEYHAIFAAGAEYMIRDGRYKYIHYVGNAPMLFNLQKDPDEVENLASDPAYRKVLAGCHTKLHSIVDPDKMDVRAKEDQRRLIDDYGGPQAVRAEGQKIRYTPTPAEFR